MNALLTSPTKSVTPPPVRKVAIAPPPVPHRFTIAEYRKLDETGLYHDKKTMLIDGELYIIGMPNPPHNIGLGLSDAWLRTCLAGKPCHVRNRMGFDIGSENNPGPDLAVVEGGIRDYSDRNPSTALLVVEIAASALAIDTGRKAELYATAGVPDYWVLDVDNRRLHIFREPQPGSVYASHTVLEESESAAPLAAPAAPVRVSDLLPNA
jgi:Uma2 family endonuclease